ARSCRCRRWRRRRSWCATWASGSTRASRAAHRPRSTRRWRRCRWFRARPPRTAPSPILSRTCPTRMCPTRMCPTRTSPTCADGGGWATVRVYLGSDHAGFELKAHLVAHLSAQGHEAIDVGPATYDAEDDYPPFCVEAARRTLADPGSLGIVLGGSGN